MHELFPPIQIYVVLAVTVATFNWLLPAAEVRSLSRLGIWFCACLMVYMMAHVLLYEYLPKVANLWMHKVSFVGYLAVSITLYHAIRKEKVAGQMSLPPELPHADASPDESRSSGVAGQE